MINVFQYLLSCSNFEATDKAVIISGALPALATICGFIITVIAWKNNVKTRRADYISDLLDRLHNDPLIKDTVYLFQYDENWYDKNFYSDCNLELKVDTTLSYLSYICYLKEKKIIRKKEFNLFKSMIDHASNNKSTLRYFYNLRHYSKVYSYKKLEKAKLSLKKTDKIFKESFTFKYLFNYIKKYKLVDMKQFKKADLSNNVFYKVLQSDSINRHPNLIME